MSREKTLEGFQCPSCGAPLEIKDGMKTVQCSYCRTMLRIAGEPSPEMQIIKKTIPKMQIIKKTIPKPALDRDVVVDQYEKEEREKTERTIALTAIMAGIILFIVGRAVLMRPSSPPAPEVYITYVPPKSTITRSPSFATHLLSFSTSVNDNKSNFQFDLAFDANGNILVTDLGITSARVNKFEADGDFISPAVECEDCIINSLAVANDGQILVLTPFTIHFYTDGQETHVMEDQYVSEIVYGLDGLFYTVSPDHSIIRYTQDGVVDLQIDKVFKTYSDYPEPTSNLAVDQLGNMYLLGASTSVIFKFAPDGTLLHQFSGKFENTSGQGQSGSLGYPKAIAIDAYGRVFVGDWDTVTVFDANGQYLARFRIANDMDVEDLAFDKDNILYVLTDEHTVEKFKVLAPN